METSRPAKYGNTAVHHNDVHQDLSSHLYRVLDVVGVSEELREGFRERAMVQEILNTAAQRITGRFSSLYIFGSQYEGTTTRGINSDIDMVWFDEGKPVVENIDDAPVDGKALFMFSDDTKPGYVKLQSVLNRTKQTINEREVTEIEDTDQQGRILVKHAHCPTTPKSERHGPADSIKADGEEEEGKGEMDFVYAYRCRTTPSFADEWLHRPRPYQWPSHEQLQRMGSYGCFIVGVGHPMSKTYETEWRVSFSLQERELMCSLNPTQHKCYVLLKMIKKDIIQPIVGKSLSSYHCKTCIFHLVESRGVEHWTPNNLVSCILECLRFLLDWVKQENCPNYFIKEENMFDKLDKSTLTNLSLVLQELLSNGVQFLYEIKCDDLGMLLTLSKSDRGLDEKKLEVNHIYKRGFYMESMLSLLNQRKNLYYLIDSAPIRSKRLSRAHHILQYLEHTTVITEHKSKDVRIILDTLLPGIRLVNTQIKCSNKLALTEEEMDVDVIQDLLKELQVGNSFDVVSKRLILASLYLQSDKLDEIQKILQKCEVSLEQYVTSKCNCQIHEKFMKEKVFAENLSFENERDYTAACMIFLPSEANLVPAALRYEMYRSVYTPPGSRDEFADWWFDWIVVDSKIYLFFLLYILYDKTNKPADKKNATLKLLLLIVTDKNLGHKETALNLLGWIYMQENRIQDAFDCFRTSLAYRPLHNAAKWHIAILINSQIPVDLS